MLLQCSPIRKQAILEHVTGALEVSGGHNPAVRRLYIVQDIVPSILKPDRENAIPLTTKALN